MELKYIQTRYLLSGILLAGGAWACAPLSAQQTHPKDTTLSRTVVVEQQYNPDIMDAQKVNVLPKVEELTTTPNEVEYDGKIAPATNIPASAMDVYAGEEKQDKTKPGYIRFGYGNRGNLDTRASYLFTPSGKDRLGLFFDMEGMNGERDITVAVPAGEPDTWDSYYYRTRAGVDYLHQFDRLNLDIAGNFGLSNFNRFDYPYASPRQKFTSGDVRFGVASTDEESLWQFSAKANLMFYSRGYNYAVGGGSLSEGIVRTMADVSRGLDNNQRAGLGVQMNNLFYNNDLLENYTTLLLNPYYEVGDDAWNLHAGANVDLSFGHGKAIRVSPDVKARYTFSDSYVLYAHATGGNILSDFRQLEQINPYGELRNISDTSIQNDDAYEQLNAVAGFKASPVPGLWLNLYGGYQYVRDELYQGLIDRYSNTNTKNANAGLQVSYEHRDLFFLSAGGKYYNWSVDDDNALWLKPAYRLDLQAGVRPLPQLSLNLGYQYIQREEMKDVSDRAEAVSNLTFNAAYSFPFGLSVYTRASNLLDKKFQYYRMYPVQGINVVGGVSYCF